MPDPDEFLMSQVKQGSAQSLEPLIRRHSPTLLTFTTRLLGDAHRGEEAFQEVCLALWQHRATYLYPRPFRPWLFRIAANCCHEVMRNRPYRDWHRDTSFEPELVPADSPPPFPAPADVAIAVETATLVEEAVARLPQQQRTVLVMRLWNSMHISEIADALQVNEATIRSTLHAALAKVRLYLEPRMR